MDVDLSLEIQGHRTPFQQWLLPYCEQLLDMALIVSHVGGQLLRTIWRLMGGRSIERQIEEEREYTRQRRASRRRHRAHFRQQQPEGGEGDFLRSEERLLDDKKLQYLRLVSVASGFPKDNAAGQPYVRGKFGEDAWFFNTCPQSDTLGVADGVGGWRNYGIDPGEFSSFLMRSCDRLSTYRNYDARRVDKLLSSAYVHLLDQKCPVLGSSTVCLMSLNREDSTVYTANIGDSGFLVVRSGRLLCRSLDQQHQFNTPYQLCSPPPTVGSYLLDTPECADFQQFVARRGDIVLLATDGVYDNIPLDVILEVISDLAGVWDPMRLQMAANSLVLMARTLSMNPEFDSPFSQNARMQDIEVPGGKPDDITVLLASVV